MTSDEWDEEFHKAAMAYRSASVVRAPDAFEALVAIAKQAATRDDVPSADVVDAQRYRWLKERLKMHSVLDGVSVETWFEDEDFDLDALVDKAIAASTPKGDGND